MADTDRIVEINGVEYKMAILGLGDLRALKEELRRKRRMEFAETLEASGGGGESQTATLKAYAAAIADIGTPEEQLKSMERLVKDGISERVKGIREISHEDISDGELGDEMSKLHGMQFIFHRLLSRNHPELTFDMVGNMINQDKIGELNAIMSPGGTTEDDENPPPPEPPETN